MSCRVTPIGIKSYPQSHPLQRNPSSRTYAGLRPRSGHIVDASERGRSTASVRGITASGSFGYGMLSQRHCCLLSRILDASCTPTMCTPPSRRWIAINLQSKDSHEAGKAGPENLNRICVGRASSGRLSRASSGGARSVGLLSTRPCGRRTYHGVLLFVLQMQDRTYQQKQSWYQRKRSCWKHPQSHQPRRQGPELRRPKFESWGTSSRNNPAGTSHRLR
jgi:hypothetical protein